MKKPATIRWIFFSLTMACITIIFSFSIAALNVRAGSEPSDQNLPSENTEAYESQDSTAAGTGEFADDTSADDLPPPAASTHETTEATTTSDRLLPGMDDAASDAEGAVSDIESDLDDAVSEVAGDQNTTVWGIILAILIIAALIALLVAFFTKKK